MSPEFIQNEPGKSYQYPPATYYYDLEADVGQNPDYGWCDYSAPSCAGRSHGDAIPVTGGLKAILAYKRDGAYLDPGVLNDGNKLDGEGPFRVVVPQKYVGPPDQSSKADEQAVLWPYDFNLDHNAGSYSRSATLIKAEPLPAGTTDIDILEAGWGYVDQRSRYTHQPNRSHGFDGTCRTLHAYPYTKNAHNKIRAKAS